MRRFEVGDTIACVSPEDAAGFGDALCKEGYQWDFLYENDEQGNRSIKIIIEGMY